VRLERHQRRLRHAPNVVPSVVAPITTRGIAGAAA
jgi:hypothetical protein